MVKKNIFFFWWPFFFVFVGMFWGLMVCWYILYVYTQYFRSCLACRYTSVKVSSYIYAYIIYIIYHIYIYMRLSTVVFLSDLFSIFIGTAWLSIRGRNRRTQFPYELGSCSEPQNLQITGSRNAGMMESKKMYDSQQAYTRGRVWIQ